MLRADTFEDLQRALRKFKNFRDPQGPYDFGGTIHLMLALLENVRQHALPEELETIGERFDPNQKEFFKSLAARLDSPSGK